MRKVLIGLCLLTAQLVTAQTYTVTTTADSGPGSLREAITEANAGNYDRVIFDVSPASTATDTIFLDSDLPTIFVTLEIDGTTESGFSSFNTPRIILKADDPSCNFGISYATDSLSVLKSIGIYNFNQSIIHTQKKSIINGVYCGNSQFCAYFGADSCVITNCVFGYGGDGSNAGSMNGVFLGGKGTIFGGTGKENTVGNIKSNAINLMNNFVSCYYNIIRDVYTEGIGPDFVIYSSSGYSEPIISSQVINATTVDIQGTMDAYDTIFVIMSDKEYNAGPVVYKTLADASGNWSFSLPKPTNKNLKFYMGRRNTWGMTSAMSKFYSIGGYYDTIMVTNTSPDVLMVGSLNWAFKKAYFGTGNKKILFAPSITLSTPITLSTVMNSGMGPNTGNVIIDGENRVEIKVPASAGAAFLLNKFGSTFELRGVRFDLMNGGSWTIWGNSYSRIISCSFYNGTGYALRSSQDGMYVDSCKFWDIQVPIIFFAVNDTLINSSIGERFLPYAGGYSGSLIGVECKSATGSYIANNTFKNIGGYSINVDAAIKMEEACKRYRIENNKIYNVEGTGIHIGATHGFISYGKHTNSVVLNNFITGTKSYGIYVKSSDSILVKQNSITCTDSCAIEVLMSSRINFSENTFASKKTGIHCYYDYYDYDLAGYFPCNANKSAPVITSYSSSVLSGTSTAGDSVEVFLSDASVNASAIKYLGKTKAVGGSWSVTIPEEWQGGSYVAIARDMDGNTSGLSNAYGVSGQRDIFVVRSSADTGCYCMREAINAANNGDADYINFDLVRGNVIEVATRYPVLTSPVVIDGTSQTGYTASGDPAVMFVYDSVAVDATDCYTFSAVAFTALDVNASDVHIKGVGFDGFGRALYLREGTNHHTVRHCLFTHTQVQNTIDLWSSFTQLDSCTFRSNRVAPSEYGCPYIPGVEKTLIKVKGANNSITHNTFTDDFARTYFELDHANNIVISDNTLSYTEMRIAMVNRQYLTYATNCDYIWIRDNNFTPAVPYVTLTGVYADTTTHLTVRHNTMNASDFVVLNYVKNANIAHNTANSYGVPAWMNRGIDMLECNHIVIDTNKIQGNRVFGEAIRIYYRPTDSVWVRDNYLKGFTEGIRFQSGTPVTYAELRRNVILEAYMSPFDMYAPDPTVQNDGILPPVVLQQVQPEGLVLKGTSTPGFRVEVFKGGAGVGAEINVQEFIGDAVTDASGNWSLNVPSTYYTPLTDHSYMATVTGLKRNTSEYSTPLVISADVCNAAALNYRYWNGEDIVSCPNDTATLSVPVAAGNIIAWTGPNSFSANTPSIKARHNGTYTVEVTNAAGTCTWKDSVLVGYKLGASVPDFLIADKAGPGETLIAVEITYPLVDSSAWNFYGSPYQKNGSYYMVTYANSGTYQVTMRSHLGNCYQDVTKTVTIDPAYAHQSHTVTPGAADIVDVIVKPNPNDGVFDLEIVLNDEKDVTVDWLNAGTHSVEREWNFSGADYYQQHINVTPLSTGIYLLRVFTKDDTRIVKVVVQ